MKNNNINDVSIKKAKQCKEIKNYSYKKIVGENLNK